MFKILLQRLIRFLAYLAAGIVILLAIAVGLFRLLLPRLPEYQDEIKAWASQAIGMEVQFSGKDIYGRFLVVITSFGDNLNDYLKSEIAKLN